MNQIPLTILHTAANLVSGIAIGTLTDSVFPVAKDTPSPGDLKGFGWLVGETTVQLITVGLLTAAFVDIADRTDPSYVDPTRGAAFMLCLGESQPNLCKKVRNITEFITGWTSKNIPAGTQAQPAIFQSQGVNQRVLANPYI